MIKVEVEAIGYGQGFNSYPVEFSFTMNGDEEDYEDGEIQARAFREAKNKTACNACALTSLRISRLD